MLENLVRQMGGFTVAGVPVGAIVMFTLCKALATVGLEFFKGFKVPLWFTGLLATIGVPHILRTMGIVGDEGARLIAICTGVKTLEEMFRIEETIRATIKTLLGGLGIRGAFESSDEDDVGSAVEEELIDLDELVEREAPVAVGQADLPLPVMNEKVEATNILEQILAAQAHVK